jgi:sugar-specific transcriptional regulator TrmB
MDDNDQQILMSPLLEKKFNDIDNKFNKILNLLEENSKRWNENKNTYINFLKENNKISDESRQILKDNRKMYLKALNNIQDTGKKELLPILNKLKENNDKMLNNTSLDANRYNNMIWRSTSANITTVKPPLYFRGFGFGNINNIINNMDKNT